MPASRPPEALPSSLAVVCHDAGATHPLLAWLRQQPGMPTGKQPQAVMEGPAKLLWPQYFPDAPLVGSLQEALTGAAMVLTGTGWASDLEHDARRMARLQGLTSVALLDHWVNYPQRFERRGKVVLPDELWVTDEHAHQEALRCFPGTLVRQIPNLYLSAQLQGIRAAEAPNAVLYLLEPARDTWGRSTPGEFQALDYFIAHLNRLGLRGDTPIVLRPHPSEDPGKYQAWLSQHPLARLDTSLNLSDALNTCGWVAGMESYALTVALAAQRRVVCTLPPWAPNCRLPHPGLIHLKDL
jgi:hypothetical protein